MRKSTFSAPGSDAPCPYLSLGDESYIFKGCRLITGEAGTSVELFSTSSEESSFAAVHQGADLISSKSGPYLVKFWAAGSWKEGEALYLAVNGQTVKAQQPGLICPDLWDFQQEAVLFLTPSDCLSVEATAPDTASDGQFSVSVLILSLD